MLGVGFIDSKLEANPEPGFGQTGEKGRREEVVFLMRRVSDWQIELHQWLFIWIETFD